MLNVWQVSVLSLLLLLACLLATLLYTAGVGVEHAIRTSSGAAFSRGEDDVIQGKQAAVMMLASGRQWQQQL